MNEFRFHVSLAVDKMNLSHSGSVHTPVASGHVRHQRCATRGRPRVTLDAGLGHLAALPRGHSVCMTRSIECGGLTEASASGSTEPDVIEEADVVVVGSGIGGLCAAALLANNGFSVIVLESHYHPGGAAHAFEVNGYCFDAGPSFHAGLSVERSTNPLKQVLDAIDERVECITYDQWVTYTPDGAFPTVCGREEYLSMIRKQGGERAYQQFLALEEAMAPLQKGASLFPAAAIRSDIGIVLIGMLFGPSLLSTGMQAGKLTGPFGAIVQEHVDDPWLLNFLDLECFVLSGMKAKDTIAAEMAFMFMERNSGESTIDYPVGGSGAIVDALIRGIEKGGGRVRLSTHVEQVLGKYGKATGVLATERKGTSKQRTIEVRAKKAVVSNLSVWDNAKLLKQSRVISESKADVIKSKMKTPSCGSFMHLHLGIDASGLPDDLDCHHLIVNDWDDIEAEQNVCIVSIPTVFDKNLAPPGKAVVHAYTAGNEPWKIWKNVQPGTEEYESLKRERTDVLWRALERVIPDIRDRAELVLEGTPHTHARFLRRHQGSYGPAISASNSSFPGPTSWPLDDFYHCGDSTVPGIGVPAAAASGMIVANTLMGVGKHLDLIRKLNIL
jgi:phytoene dehydrogenase-like protein